MTTQTDSAEVCGVMGCGLTRPEHTEKNHQFSVDGFLLPVAKQVPRRAPQDAAFLAGMVLRLAGVLLKKGILDEYDLSFVTGGPHPGSPGDPENPAPGSGG
jgi:hypothetical protein